jgi:general secretion pathway protein A
MYESHFGLRMKPFAVTPNPRFLYPSPSHREALATLVYGVKHRRGFICLVGEVGTGKTTLLRALLDGLNVSVRTALITHTTLSREDLLWMVLNELLIPNAGLSRVEMLQALHDFVVAELESGNFPPLLIVDEAQNLDDEILEEIRLLTNLEIGDTKLLQVILSGQPELDQKLARPRLRQLGQRVAVRARLEPLDRNETSAYVHHRLRIAGARDQRVFTRAALRRIWMRTGGIPRLINIVCEQALVNAFGAHRDTVSEALVEEAAHDLGLNGTREAGKGPARRRRREGRRSPLRSVLGLGDTS